MDLNFAKRRVKKRLGLQIGILVFVSNALFWAICFLFQYEGIGKILQENYQRNCIKQLEQIELNIDDIYGQIMDVTFRMESINENSKILFANSNEILRSEKVWYLHRFISECRKEMQYYPYIESVDFYSNTGFFCNVKAVGANTNLISGKNVAPAFYSTNIYQTLKDGKMIVRWFGGYTKEDFELQNEKGLEEYVEYETEEDVYLKEYYITIAKNMSRNTGQLVINIRTDELTNFIPSDMKEGGEVIYLIDENDRIVASSDMRSVGTFKEFSEGEELQDGIMRYYVEKDQEIQQILTYELTSIPWRIVSEIPLKNVIKESAYLRELLFRSFVISLIISFPLTIFCIRKLMAPLYLLVNALQEIKKGNMGYNLHSIPDNEIGILMLEFNDMSTELQRMFMENQRIEAEKTKIEISSLRAQINPHMIYNTLNNIRMMAFVNNETNIATAITLLSDFLKPIFRNEGMLCSLKEEIDYVNKYVAIMNLRVLDDYKLEIDIPEEYYCYRITRFLLQPIVENSILHGFKSRGGGTIRISMEISEDGKYGNLRIEDDGIGISPSLQECYECEGILRKDKKTGLYNVHRRLQIMYGEKCGLKIQRGGEKGTVVILKIGLVTNQQEINENSTKKV